MPRGARELDAERRARADRRVDREARRQHRRVREEEERRVGDGARQRPQRTVAAAEQVVGEIQRAEQVERRCRQSDDGERVVRHPSAAAQTAASARSSCGVVNGFESSAAPVSRIRSCASVTAV